MTRRDLSGSSLLTPKEDIGAGSARGGGSDATAKACSPEACARSLRTLGGGGDGRLAAVRTDAARLRDLAPAVLATNHVCLDSSQGILIRDFKRAPRPSPNLKSKI